MVTLSLVAVEGEQTVVNLASRKSEIQAIRSAYRKALGYIADEQFDFRGALYWSRYLVAGFR